MKVEIKGMVAFEMLTEEIGAEIDFVNKVGAKAFEKSDYERDFIRESVYFKSTYGCWLQSRQ